MTESAVGVGILGATGRMGLAIARVLTEEAGVTLAAAIDREGAPETGRDIGALAGLGDVGVAVEPLAPSALERVDVLIDFSTPDATRAAAELVASTGRALVVGTTGLDEAAMEALSRAAERAAVVVAPNMSVGVTLLFHLAGLAVERIGPDFDAEIVEMHHRRKVDAPSGTAVRLGEVVADAKGLPRTSVVHGRSGQVGARPRDEIGVMTLRGGDVVGEHTLFLAGEGERLELTHRATDRSIFARGAVRAARWAAAEERPAGRYDMNDVLDLPDTSRGWLR